MHDEVTREAWVQQERLAARCRHVAGGFEPIDLPRPEDLLARFEQGAARWPDALGLAKGDDRLSYRDLNERANLVECGNRRRASTVPPLGVGLVRGAHQLPARRDSCSSSTF
jgi:non-ribosomal peptide synthetase component F